MLRAAVLLSFLRRVLRFSTTGRPGALGACYVASWQLPRLDSHQLADDSFQGTPASCQALFVLLGCSQPNRQSRVPLSAAGFV